MGAARQRREAELFGTPSSDNTSVLPVWKELSFPLFAFLAAPIFYWVMMPLGASMSMWIHEFGHAFFAWFSGYYATPFFGVTFITNQSWGVTICFSILLGTLGYFSWQKRSPFLIAVFSLMFLVQFVFRFFLSSEQQIQAIIWGGNGGTLWIATLMVISYHYRLPETTYWSILRYIVLFVGALVFFTSIKTWWEFEHGVREMPVGVQAMWGLHSDPDRLMDEFGWKQFELVGSYLRTGYICLAIIVINYLVSAARVVLLGQSPLKDYDHFKTGHFE